MDYLIFENDSDGKKRLAYARDLGKLIIKLKNIRSQKLVDTPFQLSVSLTHLLTDEDQGVVSFKSLVKMHRTATVREVEYRLKELSLELKQKNYRGFDAGYLDLRVLQAIKALERVTAEVDLSLLEQANMLATSV